MSDQEPTAAGQGPAPEPARPRLLTAALPYVITAAAAVVLSLTLQALLWPRPPQTPAFNTATSAPATPADATQPAPPPADATQPAPPPADAAQPTLPSDSTTQPAATPAAQERTVTPRAGTTQPAATPAATASTTTPRAGDAGVLRLELLDLEAQDRRLWSALYLLRAAAQIDDAITALRTNDMAEADRALMTARRSLDRAYTLSAEQDKGPIDSFRLQLSQTRDDLRLRPEGADQRLRQLRRLVLALVDAGGL